MSSRDYEVVLEWDPEAGVWVTHVPTLSGISTFGETREEALANTREAIQGYLEAACLEGKILAGKAAVAQIASLEGNRAAFETVFAKVPDVEPDPWDRWRRPEEVPKKEE